MSVDLKPYPQYKDSGVPWLGDIPAHWNVKPGFSVLSEQKVKNIGMTEKTVLSLSYGRIIVKPPEKLHGLVPESFETYQIADPGNIIIRSIDLQNDKTSLRVGLVKERGIITSAYLNLAVKGELTPDYGYLLLHTHDLLKIFYGMGSGLRQNLDFSDFKRMPVLVPPKEEQSKLSQYLDDANRKINRFIRIKRSLIRLLNEQKQSIINQAVTRGLYSNIPSKQPSEKVSQEHIKTSMKRVCLSIRDGTHNPPPSEHGIHRLLSVRNIINGRFVARDDDRKMSVEAFLELQRSYTVETGDVVLALVGGTTGKSAVVEPIDNVTVQRSIGILRPNPCLLDSKFLNFVIKSDLVQSQIKLIMNKYAAQPGIYLTDVSTLQISAPEIDKQREIVFFIEKESQTIDVAITRTQLEIELIQEYRTRLISDVVTGKVDVRDIEIPALPDEESVEDLEDEELLDAAEAELEAVEDADE